MIKKINILLLFLINKKYNIFKYLNISILYLVVLFFTTPFSLAQDYPPYLEWKTINTEKFQLVFPAEVEHAANFTANLFDRHLNDIGKNMSKHHEKIKIIFNNQSKFFNGFVKFAPYKSEFNTFHGKNFSILSNLSMLSIHEYRHVFQLGTLSHPFSSHWLLQEFAILPVILSNSFWLLEGDAVLAETLLSEEGRGRIAGWLMEYRTQRKSNIRYSSMKSIHGSYKNYVPDHYRYGYLMSNHIASNYGHDQLSLLFNPKRHVIPGTGKKTNLWLFSNVRKITGQRFNQLHKNMWNHVDEVWKDSPKEDTSMPFYKPLSDQKNKIFPRYINYTRPYWIDENNMIAIKSGLDDTRKIIRVDREGNEQVICRMGKQSNSGDRHFSYANHRIIYSELVNHPRYLKKQYSNIYMYDLNKQERKKLLKKGTYTEPYFNSNASQFVAVSHQEDSSTKLIVVETESAEIIKHKSFQPFEFVESPRFSADGKKILFTKSTMKGRVIQEWDIETDKISSLFSYHSGIVKDIIYASSDNIYCVLDIEGVENIYTIDKNNGEVYKITHAAFSAIHPSYSSEYGLVFSNYSKDGYFLSTLKPENVIPQKVRLPQQFKDAQNFSNELLKGLADKQDAIRLEDIPNKDFESTHYRHNIINFYSLSFFSQRQNNIKAFDNSLYFLLKSRDVLSQLYFEFGLRTNVEIAINDQSKIQNKYYLYGEFSKWLPAFYFEISNQDRGVRFINLDDQIVDGFYKENSVSLGVSLPLDMSFRHYRQKLNFSIASQYINRYNHPNLRNFSGEWRYPIEYAFNYYIFTLLAQRDLYPRLGFSLNVTHKNTPFMQSKSAYTSLSLGLFLPGILRNHSLYTNYKAQHTTGLFLDNQEIVEDILGFSAITNVSNIRNVLTFQYYLPLFYPDLSIGNTLNIKRITGGLSAQFLNIGQGGLPSPTTEQEIGIDFNLFHFPITLSAVIKRSLIPINNRFKSFTTIGLRLK